MGAAASVTTENEENKIATSNLNDVLRDKRARKFYMQFLKEEGSGVTPESMALFEEIEQAKTLDKEALKARTKEIYAEFVHSDGAPPVELPERLQDDLSNFVFNEKPDDEKHEKELLRCLNSCQIELRSIMTFDSFPRFLKSEQYKQYQAMLAAGAAVDDEEGDKADEATASSDGSSVSLTTGGKFAKQAMADIYDIMDREEVLELMEADSWLAPLIQCVENIPICICICSAKVTGFPIVYINKEFEKVTQFTKADVIGKKCTFLQNQDGLCENVCELDQIERLRNALAEAMPVKVALTNTRKDGSYFKNLLSMKPIFDQADEYRYVISAQYDVTAEESTQARLRAATTLLKMIPNRIYIDDAVPFKESKRLVSLMKVQAKNNANAAAAAAPAAAAPTDSSEAKEAKEEAPAAEGEAPAEAAPPKEEASAEA